ncbi:longevity assurance proteins LAG1/LAC1 [Auriculariales sp. MPI-PUGE-AT-0066]|nr:longevity assurance proteins LAG1/LAC1 [Auriculariales sp. MPI-PUGE-AT-0066]
MSKHDTTESSFKLTLVPAVLYVAWEFMARIIESPIQNPFARLLFIGHPVRGADGSLSYSKGYDDIWFLAYWVICFSSIRLFLIVYVCHPIARRYGIKSDGKLFRFGEQGYSSSYCTFMGSVGLYVMYQLPTWYFNCTPQWTEYPQWRMTPALKTYYLLHFAYWIQQFLVLILQLEKPRKDHNEFIVHHFVTLWLIGWSYLVNLTWIGNMVHMTMDWSEALLATAKVLHYMKYETTATVCFAAFVGMWTYTRHYLNIYLLQSVWTEFDLIPAAAQRWAPKEGVWMVGWMKYQIWIPLALLQVVNLLWYFRVWRTLVRLVFKSTLMDERSDDEEEGEATGDAKGEGEAIGSAKNE